MLRKRLKQQGFGMIGMVIALALLAFLFIAYSQRYLDVLLNMGNSSQTQPSLGDILPAEKVSDQGLTAPVPARNIKTRIETNLKQSIESKMRGDDFYMKQIEGMQK